MPKPVATGHPKTPKECSFRYHIPLHEDFHQTEHRTGGKFQRKRPVSDNAMRALVNGFICTVMAEQYTCLLYSSLLQTILWQLSTHEARSMQTAKSTETQFTSNCSDQLNPMYCYFSRLLLLHQFLFHQHRRWQLPLLVAVHQCHG